MLLENGKVLHLMKLFAWLYTDLFGSQLAVHPVLQFGLDTEGALIPSIEGLTGIGTLQNDNIFALYDPGDGWKKVTWGNVTNRVTTLIEDMSTAVQSVVVAYADSTRNFASYG